MKRAIPLAALVSLTPLYASAQARPATADVPTFIVESPTLRTGEMMPRTYAPDGRNLSPPLTWRNLPNGTRQLAIICQDFGAGNPPPWVHWIVYNIPASAQGLPENIPFDPDDPMPAGLEGVAQGNNGWGLPLYRGPAPPGQTVHHYDFAVFALDEELDLPSGLSRDELLEAITGHVIGRGDLVALYRRQPADTPER